MPYSVTMTAAAWREVAELRAEVVRLRDELDKATRLLSQSIAWQHYAEIELIRLLLEKER
jgi:hypothetical protein